MTHEELNKILLEIVSRLAILLGFMCFCSKFLQDNPCLCSKEKTIRDVGLFICPITVYDSNCSFKYSVHIPAAPHIVTFVADSLSPVNLVRNYKCWLVVWNMFYFSIH